MKTLSVLILLIFSIYLQNNFAQEKRHSFQGILRDASITSKPFVSGSFVINGGMHSYSSNYNIQAGLPITDKSEVRLSFGPSCIENYYMRQTNALVSGIYNVIDNEILVSLGAIINLHIADNFRANQFDYGLFGTSRKSINDEIELISNFGFYIKNSGSLFKPFFISAGSIFDINEEFSIISEGSYWADGENLFLSIGADYHLVNRISLRGIAGLNALDNDEDISASLGILYSF